MKPSRSDLLSATPLALAALASVWTPAALAQTPPDVGRVLQQMKTPPEPAAKKVSVPSVSARF